MVVFTSGRLRPDVVASLSRDWYTGKLDFRVLHSWTGMDLSWAYLSPAGDDSFHIELAEPVPGALA